MKGDYELGGEEFYFDVLIPCIPFGGLIAIPIGLIDMEYAWSRTQGKVRVASALISHIFYTTLLFAAAL